MEPGNQTFFKEFILEGFPQNRHICVIFFIALLTFYVITIFGNIFVIVTVIFSPKLHLPMYFFLSELSFLDLCYSSSAIPKAMVDIFSRKRTISVTGCLVQMNSGTFLGGTESFLLAVMAYDRYVAICLPLHYNIMINWKFCKNVIIVMWSSSFFLIIVPINCRPPEFCIGNQVDHFMCEILVVLELACGSLIFYNVTVLVVTFFILVVPLVLITVSYILIISSVMKIKTATGRSKAFSTCTSHLTIVFIYYGTTITMYMGKNKHFASSLKYISLVYGVVTPVLNPLIYSLRNNDVKEAFQKIMAKYFCFTCSNRSKKLDLL